MVVLLDTNYYTQEVGNNATDDPPPVLISFFACDGSGTLYAGPTDATTDCQVIELDVASRSPDTPSGNEDDPTDGEGGFDYDLKDFQGYDGPFAMSINAASCQDACQYPSYFGRFMEYHLRRGRIHGLLM